MLVRPVDGRLQRQNIISLGSGTLGPSDHADQLRNSKITYLSVLLVAYSNCLVKISQILLAHTKELQRRRILTNQTSSGMPNIRFTPGRCADQEVQTRPIQLCFFVLTCSHGFCRWLDTAAEHILIHFWSLRPDLVKTVFHRN